MIITIDNLIPQVRKLIDEIANDEAEDFSSDLNAEIRQSIIMAAQKMKRDLNREFLLPVAASDLTVTPGSDGVGTVSLPDDYGELVELQMTGWTQPVTSLMEPGSKEAKEQQHVWTRGSINKPKAMMVLDASGNNVIRYFTAKAVNGSYSHIVDHLVYLPVVDDSTSQIPIVDDMYDTLLYQSAAILMLSKGETQIAEQFASMGTTRAEQPAAVAATEA